MTDTRTIVIVEQHFLVANGLRNMLESLLQWVSIKTFGSFEDLVASDVASGVTHFFVSKEIFIEHKDYFESHSKMAFVLCDGPERLEAADHVRSLDVTLPEDELMRALMSIHGDGHAHGHPEPASHSPLELLSAREKEVLTLVAEGYMNKEIADRLNISLPTVVSHRTNITGKLGIKSTASLAVFAMAHGLVTYSSLKAKKFPE